MKNKNLEKWIKALRSSKYKQGRLQLRTEDNKFCCLGVLCDVYNKETGNGGWRETFFNTKESLPSREVARWVGLSNENMSKLTFMNDEYRKSFKYIAKYIEKGMSKL